MSSIGGGSLSAGTEENNGLAQREEHRTSSPTIDPKKYMAEHSGKDILSSDVEIKGSIKFQKELLIDGKVEGEINSDGVLTIGENADIRGEIKTKSITVYGKVQGNITVGERCELKTLRRGSPERFRGWAHQDSNLGPRDYESPALTAEL